MSYKRSLPQQEDQPWLKYPDRQKSSNSHSRSFYPLPTRKHQHPGFFDQLSQQRALPAPGHSHHRHNGHATRSSETSPHLTHKRSASRLASSSSANSSSASLAMSLVGSNHSNDSLGQHHQQSYSPKPFTPANRPKNLSDELSFALQNNSTDESSSSSNMPNACIYPLPIRPSDILSIPDLSSSSSVVSAASSTSSTTTASTPSLFPLQKPRSSSLGQKLRPSALSINTDFTSSSSHRNTAFAFGPASPESASMTTASSEGPGSPRVHLAAAAAASGLATPPLPRLSHSAHSSSSASNSSYSNSSSPSSATPPCSALCQHHHSSKGHSSHSHSHHRHSHNTRHLPSCHHHNHRQDKHQRPHHPTCHYHGSKSDRATTAPIKGALPLSEPQFNPEHNDDDDDVDVVSASTTNSAPIDDPLPEPDNSVITSTAVTIVGSSPEYGIAAFKAQNDDEGALGLYSAEPPKKRQRSAAAILLGAAVETVIFTGAVALSAYQLLTGKGRQQLLEEHGSKTSTGDEVTSNAVVVSEKSLTDKHMLRIESAPVNIPIQSNRHRHAGHMAKSLHHPTHHYRSKQGRTSFKNRQGGMSTSLPHAHTYGNDHDFLKDGNLTLPGRPNTGTEDNDEQFLRMEAQLTTLIAEGKRALNSRIQDWAEEAAPLVAPQ